MSFGQDCVAFHKGSESGLQIAPKGCKRVKKFKKLPSSCWRVLIFGRASVAVQVLQVQHRFLHLVGAASVAAPPVAEDLARWALCSVAEVECSDDAEVECSVQCCR